jgi:hypothetical protein
VIDLHAGLVNAMGPRMILARMPKPNHRAVIIAAARNVGRVQQIREAFAAATAELFDSLDLGRVAQPDGVVDEALRDVSEFVAIARSPVQRRNGRIVLVGEPEVGSRLYHGLAQQRRGLVALGCDVQRADAVVRRMGMDSIPALHRQIIDHLVSCGVEAPGTHNIAASVGYPDATAVDVLEELVARGAV